jgi:chromosome segregation ATPase
MKMTDDDLRTAVREFKASVSADIERLERRMDRLTHELRERITTVETAFLNTLGELTHRVDRTEQRVVRLEGRMDEHDHRFDRLDARLDELDGRFDRVDGRFDGVDGRFDGVDGRFDGLDATLQVILDRLGPAPS